MAYRGNLVMLKTPVWVTGRMPMFHSFEYSDVSAQVSVPKLAVVIDRKMTSLPELWIRVMTVDGEVGWILEHEAWQL